MLRKEGMAPRAMGRALERVQEIMKANQKPSTRECNRAMQACATQGLWSEALSVLGRMQKLHVQPDVWTFNSALHACARRKKWESALRLLREMAQEGLEPNLISYSATISACGRAAKWGPAQSLFREMKDREIMPDVILYSAVISACEKGSLWARALLLYQEMKDRGIAPDVISYNAVISACEGSDQRILASELYRKAFECKLYNHWKTSPDHPLVDFHSYPSFVAKAALRVIMDDIASHSIKKDLILIVGQGIHSEGDPKLKPELLEMLSTEFTPPLVGKVQADNPGRIHVAASSITRWIHGTKGNDWTSLS
eukprot:GEMP01055796.1.p1 GENE.GEMP01055796.1~~GEMP01055796.1.p1  ORF type:complete len:313 (+),score=52.80 GEMP01055796.1:172-1110(+)